MKIFQQNYENLTQFKRFLSFVLEKQLKIMVYGKRHILLCSLTILLTFFISCNHKENDPTVFYYNEPDGINTLDPARMGYRAAIWAGTQLYNGLVQLDSSLQPVACLARSWQADSTGTIWTFSLRNDVYFHGNVCFGEKKTRRLTAHDVKYSFERVCDSRTKSTGAWIFRGKVRGAEEFIAATKNDQPNLEGISGIEAVDDSTLKITLTKPFPPFVAMLATPYCFVVPHEAVEYYGNDFFKNPVGTGAFTFKHWKADAELLLERNPNYFERDFEGKQLPYLSGISVSFLRDTKSEFLQFKQKKFDFISAIDPSFASLVIAADGKLTPEFAQFKLFQAAAHSIDYYGIMLDSTAEAARLLPLARSRALRQALNYAVDRENIVRYVLQGKGIPAHNGVLPPGMPGFSDEVHGYSFNPDKARALLAEAGFPNGQNLPPITIQLGQNERTAAVAEAVQEQWKTLGITATIKQVDFPQHLEMVRSGKLPLWRTSWIGDYPDPENFLALFYSPFIAPKGPNTTHFARHDTDSLYERGLLPRLSVKERFAVYNQMERIVLEESPWVFLYYNILQRLVQPEVEGFSIDGADRLILKTVRKRGR